MSHSYFWNEKNMRTCSVHDPMNKYIILDIETKARDTLLVGHMCNVGGAVLHKALCLESMFPSQL